MSRLMGAHDIKSSGRFVYLRQMFIVAFYYYLRHQMLHEVGDVLRGDLGHLHRGCGASLAVLTEAPHLDCAPFLEQAHVEDNHHLVGGPASLAH